MSKKIEIRLPDGFKLVAETCEDPKYPGIRISLQNPNDADELICFAEYNSIKPEGKQLCVCAYSYGLNEPAYYESYNAPASPSPNV